MFQAAKAGHTGSLDPLATGVLPICFGEATKVSQFLLDAQKEYVTTIRLGLKTKTADSEGEVLAEEDVPRLDSAAIRNVLSSFLGQSEQVPPIYSALKQQGVPLYKLARQGKEIAPKSRSIFLYELELLEWQSPLLSLRVKCSKGTYIRSLAEDIAVALGTLGHVAALRRTQSGPFTLITSHTLEALMEMAKEGEAALDNLLLPMDLAVQHLRLIELHSSQSLRLRQGQPVLLEEQGNDEFVRVYDSITGFIGIGRLSNDGKLCPERLLSY